MTYSGNSFLFSKICRDLKEQDFAVVDLETTPSINSASIELEILSLAKELRIGLPFVPDMYRDLMFGNHAQSDLFNCVGGPEQKTKHPAFSTQDELALHTDGTLNSIGEVRLSILGCVAQAHQGGETVLLRAASLAEYIMNYDCDILAPLFDSRAMRRHTTIGENPTYAEGPILKWVGGELFASYCTTPRDEWRFDTVPYLREARWTFEEAISNIPEFTFSFVLKKRQVLIMDNSRISHGRKSFSDNLSAPRHLVRALFRSYPVAA